MPVNTNFNYDVFISYAPIDDKPLGKEAEGWITTLHKALEIRLSQLLGEVPKIWRDPKLQGNDFLEQVIVDQLLAAATLITVLSPRYVKSECCMKELEEFIKAAEQNDSLHIDNEFRVFKVVKTYIPLEEHPAELRMLLGYEFFKIDQSTGRPYEFNQAFGDSIQPEFWKKLDDLAYEICQFLKKLKTGAIDPPSVAPSSGSTIYLAETTSDLHLERDQIRRELLAHGYTVLPDQPLPLSGPELENLIQENLEHCTLSIHLIGENYGIVPETALQSIVDLQNALATKRSQQVSNFSRLAWISQNVKVKDERQKRFITALLDDPALQQGDELLQSSLEELKTIIQDKLNTSEPAEESTTGQELTRIYLICDQRDLYDLEPLEDDLYNQGFEVLKPLFDADESEISQEHQENLRICDAVLIYYGQAKEVWLRGKLRDLRKAHGYKPYTHKLAKAIYIAGPENRSKTRYRTHEVDLIIKNFGDFSADQLAPFLKRVKQRKGEQN